MDDLNEHKLINELDAAWDDRDQKRAYGVVAKLMEEAEAGANLAAASTAIDSNLAKLDEIKGLHEVIRGGMRGDEQHGTDNCLRRYDGCKLCEALAGS